MLSWILSNYPWWRLKTSFFSLSRCFCSNCSTDLTTKAEECQCCQEIDRCGEVMEQFGDRQRCITLHPGFQDVCLNKHVLEIAALSRRLKLESHTKRCLFKDEERKQSKFSSTSHHFSQRLFFALSRTGFQSFLGPLQDFSSIIFNTAAKEKLNYLYLQLFI